MMGCLNPNLAALDWQQLRAAVTAHGQWRLGAVPPAHRATIAAAAGLHGLQCRVAGAGVLVLELAVSRKGSAGPRLPKGR